MIQVSILTPSFNQALWLTDNLRSVASQTYSSIEHIVMDGGSTDASVQILRDAGARVIWTSEPDRGQSHALNKAFAQSNGEIIGWLNSDDAYVDRRAVETAVDIFRREPDVGVVYGHGLLVNRSNHVLQFLWAPPFNHALFDLLNFFVQPSAFIRRSVLTDPLVREDLHFVMDRDLWFRLRDKTRFRRIDLIVGLDRHQPARKTLLQEFPRERDDYLRTRGIDPTSTWWRGKQKAAKVALRALGITQAMRLPHGIDPAIDLTFDRPTTNLVRQVGMPRRYMPAD